LAVAEEINFTYSSSRLLKNRTLPEFPWLLFSF
jgi:hypothetical protein